MILGICSIAFYLAGLILGGLAIAFYIKGKNKIEMDPMLKGSAMGIAGLVTGIVGGVLCTVLWTVVGIAISRMPTY